jgi:hypothetical protein
MSGLILAGTEMSPGTEVVIDINLVVDVEHRYLLRRQVMPERVPKSGQIVLRESQFYGRLPQESVPANQTHLRRRPRTVSLGGRVQRPGLGPAQAGTFTA